MTLISSAFSRDANYVPITNLGLVVALPTITYAASTTGATGTTTLFTVTGVVAARVFGVCSADLTSGGSATIEVGIAGSTASIIPQVAFSVIDSGEIWSTDTPATVLATPTMFLLSGTNIIQTIATATITGGALTYYCVWTPISSTGNVT